MVIGFFPSVKNTNCVQENIAPDAMLLCVIVTVMSVAMCVRESALALQTECRGCLSL